ncbi:HpcH/HpaI aldolase/citrate lyase family protein [Streptomyces sp. H39-S7]|uniref:HpcH/HpaI aldolase/citrate lyase family protein n=1 Tax=Streptomyces sp. H39-S7 TaxID=3004357 RepID=UPI0022AFCC8C|nr:CoA ester lyase [Streptomyces sp. H39-S7]MCZ4120289.1 CoA ester lyase [Streptomyces sp. H39-S7]
MEPTTAARPGRAWIITPALRPRRFPTAHTSGAGVALVDLEDSVAMPDKQAARIAAREFFDRPDAPCTLGVRINAPTTLEGARDLVALAAYQHKPDLILIPKTESARDIELVASVLDTDGYTPDIWALIETPRAIDKLPSITKAHRLGGVVFGSADYAATLHCALNWQSLLYARCALVNSATAAGIPAIDAPTFVLNDVDALRCEAEKAKELGFHGKGAVHPRRAALINEIFAPSIEEIARARAIVAAGEQSGNGITAVDGQMVGTPFFAAARALVHEVDG